MERKLLDMTNQLFISEYNSRVEYGDQFKFAKWFTVHTVGKAKETLWPSLLMRFFLLARLHWGKRCVKLKLSISNQ